MGRHLEWQLGLLNGFACIGGLGTAGAEGLLQGSGLRIAVESAAVGL